MTKSTRLKHVCVQTHTHASSRRDFQVGLVKAPASLPWSVPARSLVNILDQIGGGVLPPQFAGGFITKEC